LTRLLLLGMHPCGKLKAAEWPFPIFNVWLTLNSAAVVHDSSFTPVGGDICKLPLGGKDPPMLRPPHVVCFLMVFNGLKCKFPLRACLHSPNNFLYPPLQFQIPINIPASRWWYWVGESNSERYSALYSVYDMKCQIVPQSRELAHFLCMVDCPETYIVPVQWAYIQGRWHEFEGRGLGGGG